MRVVTFDLEIARTIEEVGGWDAARRGEAGLSCAVTAVLTPDPPEPTIRVWDTPTIESLAEYLEAADCVVTFNGRNFDFPCLGGIVGRALTPRRDYDILAEIWRALGARRFKGWGLAAVGEATLGRGKSGHGALAPIQWQEGRIAEVINYCMDDVLLTQDLYRHILNGGKIIGADGTSLSLPRGPHDEADIAEEASEAP